MRGVDISPETWRKTQNLMKTIISGILAGIAISTGGTVFLLTDSKITGAIFFSVGLFTVCAFGFSLFTGRVCYVFDHDRAYALKLPLIWTGNLIGSLLAAVLEMQTRLAPPADRKGERDIADQTVPGPSECFYSGSLLRYYDLYCS